MSRVDDVRDDAQETGPEVQLRQAVEERRYRELWLSVAGMVGKSNQAPQDVLAALMARLQERDELHQGVADIAEKTGHNRDAPIGDLLQIVGELAQAEPGVAFANRVRQALGLQQETTHRDIVDAIADLQRRTKTADLLADLVNQRRGAPVKVLLDEVRKLAEAAAPGQSEAVHRQRQLAHTLGMDPGATWGQLFEVARQLRDQEDTARSMIDRDGMATSEEVGLMRELAEEVRTALELPPEARNAAVLNRIANLQATVADLTEPPVETVTMEEVERQRETRLGALTKTLELWRTHQMGDVPGVEDLVAMAEWLVSGDTGPAAAANDAMVRRGLEHQRQQGGVVDGARWTPGDHVG